MDTLASNMHKEAVDVQQTYLMVPVGEGMGDTNGDGEVYWEVSTRVGRAGLCMGGGGPRSSRSDVNAILI